jgi:hypothetical protein
MARAGFLGGSTRGSREEKRCSADHRNLLHGVQPVCS